MPKIDGKDLTALITGLATAPDGQLAKPLAQECKNFVFEDETKTIRFLRDLRDKAVYTGGASMLVMSVFSTALNGTSEPEEEMKTRRADLERKLGV